MRDIVKLTNLSLLAAWDNLCPEYAANDPDTAFE